jgi:hypothetical protein
MEGVAAQFVVPGLDSVSDTASRDWCWPGG